MNWPDSLPSPFASEAPEFSELEAAVWQYQLRHTPLLTEYARRLDTDSISYLPISFFKAFDVQTAPGWEPELVFESSRTTGQTPSRHLVRSAAVYRESLLRGFRHFYGSGDFTVLALLPNYLERGSSSLVHMVKIWIEEFGLPGSGFYLYDHAALAQALAEAMDRRERILLIGVSFALLDFAAAHPLQLPQDAIVMETGGMKGRRKEVTRQELHAELSDAFGVPVHSEYGMTELLSQAYALGGDRFRCPPWMQVKVTDPYRPWREMPTGEVGRLNVTDLANVWSCSFIRTDDLGRCHPDGSFEVLGRLDHAELRGCNLMAI